MSKIQSVYIILYSGKGKDLWAVFFLLQNEQIIIMKTNYINVYTYEPACVNIKY